MSKNWRNTTSMNGFISGILGTLLIYGSPETYGSSQASQDVASLKSAVVDAIESHVGDQPYVNLNVSVRSIDQRLRLKKCTEDLETLVTNPTIKIGRMTVEVRCDAVPAWKIYVQATATAEMTIPVLAKPIQRGQIIGKSDLTFVNIQLGRQTQQFADSMEYLVGMELTRSIRPGQPIPITALKAPEIVKRGQLVSIRYDNTDMQIVVAGKAVQNGAKGDWIRVENASSGKQIEGRVNSDGSISVPSI